VVTSGPGPDALAASGPPAGALTPADLQAAYGLPSSSAGSGQTIAVVDAFDHPRAETDLAAYRARFGLAPCTGADGCFTKVNQAGARSPMPRVNGAWAQEIALDLEMASATCPKCRLVLVEADSGRFADLGAAVDTAVGLHADVVNNSYGSPEFATERSFDGHYDHPGTALTVSTGDAGYGAQFPASSGHVTAVGGTRLVRKSGGGRGWSESAWAGGGSGCSRYVAKPAWQRDHGCPRRTVADVAAVADPATGVAVYYSSDGGGTAHWYVFGGTSASAPIVAGAYALAGNAAKITYGSYPYRHASALHDVVAGSNGTCTVRYLCQAVSGYDGPTGLGTPAGVGAF